MTVCGLDFSVLAARRSFENAVWIAVWGGGLIVLLIVAWLVLTWLRRRYFGPRASASQQTAWSLDDVRQLHRDGMISDEEYARLRGQVLASFGKAGQAPAGSVSQAAGPPEARPTGEPPPEDPDHPPESAEPSDDSEHKQ